MDVSEARDFLGDRSADKRERLIARLLADSRYPQHMIRVWGRIMIPPSSPQPRLAAQLRPWLQAQFRDNVAYDKVVRELLSAPARTGSNTPGVFYVAVGNKPAPATAAVARIFLGTRIGCAECHDHPFTTRTQEDFWGVAAFFSDVGSRQPRPLGKDAKVTIRRPETKVVYTARYLDGKDPTFLERQTARQVFADWVVTHPDFAATAANRLWQHLFGRGLAEPVDSLDEVEERPAMLAELGRRFADADFDIRWYLAGLCRTKAYQRASDRDSLTDTDLFTHVGLKTLTSEQVFDALEQALSLPITADRSSPRYSGQRQRLIDKLDEATGESPEQYRAGILQALVMLNGELVLAGTDLNQSRTLRAVVEAPFLSPSEKIETLYLAALTRPPRPEELQTMIAYVSMGRSEDTERQAYADVFWALLNSPEFVLNH